MPIVKIHQKNPANPSVATSFDLASDHYPQQIGDVIIWNINNNIDEEVVAKNIARMIRDGVGKQFLLQEVPNQPAARAKLIANINDYLPDHQKIRVIANSPLGTQPYGNIILTPANQHYEPHTKKLSAELENLKQFCANNSQVSMAVVKTAGGADRLLVNIHRASPKSKTEVPIDLQQLFLHLQQIKALNSSMEIICGGDSNLNQSQLKSAVGNMGPMIHAHSIPGSSFKNEGTPPNQKYYDDPKLAVDAVFHSGIANFAGLKKLDNYNNPKPVLAKIPQPPPPPPPQPNAKKSTVKPILPAVHGNVEKSQNFLSDTNVAAIQTALGPDWTVPKKNSADAEGKPCRKVTHSDGVKSFALYTDHIEINKSELESFVAALISYLAVYPTTPPDIKTNDPTAIATWKLACRDQRVGYTLAEADKIVSYAVDPLLQQAPAALNIQAGPA